VATLHDAWEAIRLRVINDFSKQIGQKISYTLQKSDGWIVDAETFLSKPQDKYSGIGVRRSTWDEGLQIGIEAEAWGPASWVIGSWRREGYQHPKLAALLREKWGPGKQSETWLWYHYFGDGSEFGHRELEDWRTGAAVVALRQGAAGIYGKRLCERIIDTAKTVDGVF